MNISQIGHEWIFRNDADGKLLPHVSGNKRAFGNEGETDIEVTLLGKRESGVYDRRGTLIGEDKESDGKQPAGSGEKEDINGNELSREENRDVEKLKTRDLEVRAHEQAHMAAGGSLVRGGAHYEYQKGPDGRIYAVGGEVKIDISEEKTPEKTVQKMQRVQAAALAPAEPSGQDRAVAAAAAKKAQAARMEMARESNPEASSVTTGQAVREADSTGHSRSHAGYGKALSGSVMSRSLNIII